ncbi:MAG: TonB-dependent receptor [Verrucomicrobia bacterium]|nr:TonB-dependent receptor [Verrucomicrobiota bacterium]
MHSSFAFAAIFALLLCSLFGSLASAQPQPAGTIVGQISNQGTGAYLEGATVTIEGTDIGTTTERDGSFRLAVAPGTHTVVATYSGLDPERATLVVSPGQPAHRDFALTSQIYKLSPFVVATEREGNALAATIQRQAPNVKNVVSSDAFGSLSGNPAELLERIPGVVVDRVGGDARYIFIRGTPGALNSIQIDGNRRASYDNDRGMAFESIGSDHIESIELVKSPTPDMDADAIGGTVNLKSRSAFNLTGRRFTYSVGGLTGYRRYRQPRPAGTIFFSDVFNAFGGSKNLGISLSGNFRQHIASMDFAGVTQYQNTTASPAYMYNFSYDGRVNLRSRWGGGMKIDYRLSDSNTIFANFTMSPHSERAHVPVYTVSTAQTVATLDAQGRPTGTGAILPGYTDNRTEARAVTNSQLSQSYLHRLRDNDAYSAQFGGRLAKSGYELDYDVSYSISKQKQYYDQSSAVARGFGWILDRTNTSRWTPVLSFTDGPSPMNLDNYATNQLLRFHQPTSGELYGAQINYLKRFNLAAPALVKAGLKVRSEDQIREDVSQRWSYLGPDGVANSGDERLSQFQSESWTYRPYHGIYPAVPLISPDEMGAHLVANPNLWQEDVVYTTTQNLNNNQKLTERVTAGYVVGNVRINRFSILAGLRVERTELDAEGPQNHITAAERARRAAWVGPVTNAENIRRIKAQYGDRRTVSGDYQNVFPGVHLKYEPIRGLIFRGSYSSSVGRPAFGTILPRDTIDEDNKILTSNNTDLRPQYSNNFDATAEYYFEPVGLLSAGVFLKEISDYIYNTSGQIIGSGPGNGFDGEYAGFELRSQANGGFAKIKGWEVNYRQQFTFLPGWLGGFGAFANYTWLDTKGNYGGTTVQTTGTLPGFTPRAANVGLSYIRGKYNLRVAYGYAGEILSGFNAAPNLRNYRLASHRLDLKIKYRIWRNYDVYVDVYNLNNDKQSTVWGVHDRPRQILDRNDPQIHFGINGRL